MHAIMPDSDLDNSAVALVNHINAAITNVRLYPPKSALIVSSMERLNAAFAHLLSQTPAISYAESGKKLLIQGEPLAEKTQNRPQIKAFMAMLLEYGIKSITFKQGLTSPEINDFLQLLGNPPDDVSAGGLQELMAQKGINNIRIDEKIYVERGSDQSIVAGMDFTDEEIGRAVFGEQAVSAEARAQLREMAGNPEWLSRVFQAGVRQLLDSAEGLSTEENARQLGLLIDSLTDISDLERKEVLSSLVGSMAEMEERVLFTLFAHNLETVFGTNMFENLVNGLDENRFKQVYGRVEQMMAANSPSGGAPLGHVLELMRRTEKAKSIGFSGAGSEADTQTAKNDASRLAARELKMGFNRLLSGDVTVLPSLTEMDEMGRALATFVAKGQPPLLNILFDKLLLGLQSADPRVKESAGEVAAALDDALAGAGRLNERFEFSKRLVTWLKHEKSMSKAFELVSAKMESIAQSLIRDERIRDAAPVLEAYQFLEAGDPARDEAIQALAAKQLENLVSDEFLDFLLREKTAKTGELSEEDDYSLELMGTAIIERLFDRLYNSHNRSERNRIVQLITRIGAPARRPLLERLRQGGPWFYVRNLVMLLGRIGDEQHMNTLSRCLEDSDFRVQREAVLAIQNIGGTEAGDLLLKRLEDVSDPVKSVIISVLGMMNYQKALPYLIMKLEDRGLGESREARAEINAKICEALGRMGDARARPLLEQVARSRKIFWASAYDPKVRAAAASALAHIEQAGTG